MCREEYLSQVKIISVKKMQKYPRKATGNMKNIEKIHQERTERVEAVCEKYNHTIPKPISDLFLFEMKNSLAWCRIPKVTGT